MQTLETLPRQSWLAQNLEVPTPTDGDKSSSRDIEFRAEFAAQRQRLERIGMDEESYVLSRRIDCGLALCEPKSVTKAREA